MCVPIISNCDSMNLQNISVPLPFEKGQGSWTWHNVVMWKTFVPIYFNIHQCRTKLQSGHDCCVRKHGRTDGFEPSPRHILLLRYTFVQSYFKILPCMTKLQSGHECVSSNSSRENEYLQTKSVTLTLKVGTEVSDSTCRLVVVDISAQLLLNPSMHDKVTVRKQMSVPINSNCDNSSVTLTFEVGTWALAETHHLDVVDIYA
jgi:hypothetical protein